MYWNGHMSAAGWILSVVWTVIILALVIAGILWLVSALGDRNARPPSGEMPRASAREILDLRLARGEITVEEYRQLRQTIGDPVSAPAEPQPAHPAGRPG